MNSSVKISQSETPENERCDAAWEGERVQAAQGGKKCSFGDAAPSVGKLLDCNSCINGDFLTLA
jgi:hypothetical protein